MGVMTIRKCMHPHSCHCCYRQGGLVVALTTYHPIELKSK
jgi:hypothetical protein